jgi:tetraacyldisaccharide 4'-kinase
VSRLLWPLLPMVPLYDAARGLNGIAYERGWRRIERLRWPVVSVGNLSIGGAGKTPFVIALARAMAERGWAVDVLSRGYGRTSDAAERVIAEGADGAAHLYGDEPWLIAREAGLPVFVARHRAAAGQLAEQTLADAGERRHVHLLDDGMQHRGLARDAEIVLLHRSDFETTMLPAGRLREPLTALKRANFVVLRREDAALADRARRWMRSDAQLWTIRRDMEMPALPGAAVVFCAIAHGKEFVEGVQKSGATIAAARCWRDHHRFTERDVDWLREAAVKHQARCFLTTEKDLMRLTGAQRARLEEIAPLLTVRLKVWIENSEAAFDALEAHLAQHIA